MRAIVALLVSLWVLVGCQSDPQTRYTGWIGERPEGADVALSDYEPPRKLGVFRLQGEMDFPDRQMRVFRYHHMDQRKQKMDIALYPLPPGWTDLPGERAVAGHYGQVKQSMAKRISERHKSDVEVISEELRKPGDLAYPVAEGVFRERTDQWTRTLVLELSARKPVFVRVTSDFSGPDETELVEAVRTATHAFLRYQGETTADDS